MSSQCRNLLVQVGSWPMEGKLCAGGDWIGARMAEPGQGAFCPSSTHPLYLVCGLQKAGKMPLLTSLLPCQELWALGEQLYFHMATVTAPFAVISPLRKDSHLVEVARLALSKCLGKRALQLGMGYRYPRGAEDPCFSWEEVAVSIPASCCSVAAFCAPLSCVIIES